MKTFFLFFDAIRLMLTNWRFLWPWAILYAVLMNGFEYAFEYLPFDFLDLYMEFGAATALTILMLGLGFALIIFICLIAPLEILWFRTTLEEDTNLAGFANLWQTIWRYFRVALLMNIALILAIGLAFALFGVANPDPPSLDAIVAASEGFSISQAFRNWRHDQSYLLVGAMVQVLLASPLVGIALGHTAKYWQVVKWHLRHFVPTVIAVMLTDTLFYAVYETIDHAFAYENSWNLYPPHFAVETIFTGLPPLPARKLRTHKRRLNGSLCL